MAEAALQNQDLYDLTMSEEAQPLLDAVKKHITENVDPILEDFNRYGEERENRWEHHPKQIELVLQAVGLGFALPVHWPVA